MDHDKEITTLLSKPATKRRGFELMVRQYSQQLYWHVRRIVISHDDADDVVQDIFLKLWNSIDTFRAEAQLSTWLYRVATNESIDFIRRKGRTITAADDETTAENLASRLMADKYFDGDETAALLQEAVSQLPEVQRMVFNMRYYDDMPYRQISQILGTSEGGLKASYHHAVKKIKQFFDERD